LELLIEKKFPVTISITMRNAFGLLIVLWGLSKFFTTSFEALDGAARESFKLIEVSAVSSQMMLEQK
jgi:hypothetical protein